MCRPRQCSSATNWWKFPSVTFSVSSKDNRGFCIGRGGSYPTNSRRAHLPAPPTTWPRPQEDLPSPTQPIYPFVWVLPDPQVHLPLWSSPLTCADGKWGTASRSRPCSWEWMLARARWDSVSLCERTGGRTHGQCPGLHPTWGPRMLGQPCPPPLGVPICSPLNAISLARSPHLLERIGDGLAAQEIIIQDV